MEEKEIRPEKLHMWIVTVLFLGMMAMFAIYIRGLIDKLDALERQMNDQITAQQSQMDGLSLNIETVRNDMNAGFDDQQKQLDIQAEQIRTTKQNLHNPNQAFTSFRKQQNRVEEELREELKKD